jgi:thiol-disulfide isomerase/thioredoxin
MGVDRVITTPRGPWRECGPRVGSLKSWSAALLLPFVFLGVAIGAGAASAAGDMPASKVERWVNSTPLTADMLRGKVVLVDFWEYTCINWIRTSPYVKAWHRDYADRGLVVVGVHAPEFESGKRAENIDRGIRGHGLTYPIALDNGFATWRAFGNDAWPTKYLFDAHGTLVKRWVGEGSYGDIEAEIRRLLVAASPGTRLPPISPEATAFAKTSEPSYAGGDVVPKTDVARGVAVIEAVSGQLYIAVMIANLVGARLKTSDGGDGPMEPIEERAAASMVSHGFTQRPTFSHGLPVPRRNVEFSRSSICTWSHSPARTGSCHTEIS